MKKIITLLLITLACAACSKETESVNITKLTIASDCTWPPMEMVNENKEIVGFDIDLIKAIGEAAGVEVVVRNTAWEGIFAGLASNEYDAVISSVTITEDRKKAMDFSEPYINAGQIIVVRSEDNSITTIADLAGKKAGAQIGTTGAIEIAKNSDITGKTYDEIGLAIEDLANGRIDAVVCDTPIAANYALQTEQYKEKLKITGTPFTKEFYGIAVKKGNKEALAIINAGLKKLSENGTIKELENKWLR